MVKTFKITLLILSLLTQFGCASRSSNVLHIGFADLVELAFSGDGVSPAEAPRSKFHQAIVSGDINLVKHLFDSQTRINTPLADISSINEKQYLTALGEAVKYNHTEITRYLLDNGAKPNVPNTTNPLVYALDNKNLSLAKMLLDSGVDPDDAKESKISLLMIAVDEGDTKAVWLLLENGANPLLETQFGETAHSIARAKNDQVSQQLILNAIKSEK